MSKEDIIRFLDAEIEAAIAEFKILKIHNDIKGLASAARAEAFLKVKKFVLEQ